MAKVTVSAEEILADIKARAHDSALMKKYRLTEKGLQRVFEKLIAAKVITQAELDRRASSTEQLGAVLMEDSVKQPTGVMEKPRQKQKRDPATIEGRSKEGHRYKNAVIAVLLIISIVILVLLLPLSGQLRLVLLVLFLDFASSVAIWLLICCLMAFIIAKIRKAESTKWYFQKAAWAALIISVLALIPSATRNSRS